MMTLQEKAGHRLLSTPVCHKRKQWVWNRHLLTWKGWAVIAEHICTHCRNTAVLGFPGGSLVVANQYFLKSLGIESLLLNEINRLMGMMLKHFFIFVSFIISFLKCRTTRMWLVKAIYLKVLCQIHFLVQPRSDYWFLTTGLDIWEVSWATQHWAFFWRS